MRVRNLALIAKKLSKKLTTIANSMVVQMMNVRDKWLRKRIQILT
jgi:hypothetical protein